jgi:hypothetical protein
LSKWFAEAKRRKVFQTAGVYLVGVWVISQGAVELGPLFGAPDWLLRALMVAAVAFAPVVVILAWLFDIGPAGIVRDPQDVEETRLGRDLAEMSTGLGLGLGRGAVALRWADEHGENYKVFVEDFVIGRASDCRVRFSDPLVSRQHARVFSDAGTWRIEDLGSRNGTVMNNESISSISMAPISDVVVNEAGPLLRFELVAPGPETKDAISQCQEEGPVAHIRLSSGEFDRTRGGGTEES